MIKDNVLLLFALALMLVGVAPNPQQQSNLAGVKLVMFSAAEAAAPIAGDTGLSYYMSVGAGIVEGMEMWLPNITYSGSGKLTCSIVFPTINGGQATVAPDCLWGTYKVSTLTNPFNDVFAYAVCDGVACDFANVSVFGTSLLCDIYNEDGVAAVTANTSFNWGPNFNIRGSCQTDSYTIDISQQPKHGTITLGTVRTYTPNPGYTGSDLFEYTVTGNGQLGSRRGTVGVTVTPAVPPPVPPVAHDISLIGISSNNITWRPIASDPDNSPSPLSCRLGTPPKNGTATVATDCSAGSYQSNPGFIGDDTFTYIASDGQSDSNTAVVTASIHPIPVPGNPLPPGTLLPITKGIGSSLNKPCSVGSCIGFESKAFPGDVLWVDFAPGLDGGFVVGKAQKCIDANTSELTAAWSFLNGPWTLCTDPGGEQNLFSDTSCVKDYCLGQTELKNLYLAWGVTKLKIGSSYGCFLGSCSADQRAGIFVDEYLVDDLASGAWQMRSSHVVQGPELPGVRDTRVYLIFRGNLKAPAPVVKDVLVTVTSGQKTNWQPDVTSVNPLACRIGTGPVNGSATVASDCSSGTYQSNPGFVGTDTFTYIANDGQADSNTGTVTVAVTEPPPSDPCLAQYPVSQFIHTGKEASLSITFTGNITSYTNKVVKVCPGTPLKYQTSSTQGPVVCQVKNNTTRGSGSLRINDHIKCTDKPAGKDKVHFKVKSGVTKQQI